MRQSRRLPWTFSLCLCLIIGSVVAITLKNVTIDDTFGGPDGLPTYLPSTGWAAGQDCPGCGMASYITSEDVLDGTWHDTTWHPPGPDGTPPINMTIHFTGVAIYAYCLLGNNAGGVTTYTEVYFLLDGEPSPNGPFIHQPDENTAAVQYDVLVYSDTSLPNGTHTLVMQLNGGNQSALLLFDYANYTVQVDDSTTSDGVTTVVETSTQTFASGSPSHTAILASNSGHALSAGAISGIVVGLICLAVLLIIVFLLLRLHRRRQLPMQQTARMNPPQMGQTGPTPYQSNYTHEPFVYPAIPSQSNMTSVHTRGKTPLPSTTDGLSGTRTAALREEIEGLRLEVERLRRDDAELRRAAQLRAEVLSARPPPSEFLPEYVDDRAQSSEIERNQ